MAYKQKLAHAPVDPGTMVPRAVREAAERSELIQKQMNEANERARLAAETSGVDPDATVLLAPDPVLVPENTNTPPKTPNFQVSDAPIAPQTPENPPQNTQNTQNTAQNGVSEADYKREKEAWIGRQKQAQTIVTQQNARIAELEAMVISMQQNAAHAPVNAPQITEEERAAYGDDLIALARKAARAEMSGELGELAQLRADNAQLKAAHGQMAERQDVSAKDRLLASLSQEVPDWKVMNNDQGFLQWLALPERFQRATRQEQLTAAWQAHDAYTVAEFFKAYKAETATSVPHVPQAQPTKVPLENFAAPGRAAQTPATPSAKPMIKRSTINQFYHDVTRGRYANNPAAKNDFEAAIFDAQLEGRVVEG